MMLRVGVFFSVVGCLNGCKADTNNWVDAEAASIASVVRTDTLHSADGTVFTPTSSVGSYLRNNTFAVADAYEQRIAVFDTLGTMVHTVGRRGSGPGEFQNIGGIFSLPGDSVMVFDPISHRLHIFDGAYSSAVDQVIPEWTTEGSEQTTLVGRFSDGRLVGIRRRLFVSRTSAIVARVDTPQVVVGRLGSRPQPFFPLPILRSVSGGAGSVRFQLALGEIQTVVGAVCDEGIIVVDTSGVRVIDLAGRTVQNYSLPFARQTISEGERDEILDRAAGTVADPSARATSRLLLASSLKGVQSAFLVPTIDATGKLWFGVPNRRRTFAQTELGGRVNAVVVLPRVGFPFHYGSWRMPMVIPGSDSTDAVVELLRMAPPAVSASSPLGWCHPLFRP